MSNAENSDRDAAPQWIDTVTAAAILGVSERAVQRRCKSGKIAARRVPTPTGQQWQIDRAALDIATQSDDGADTNDIQSDDTDDTQNREVTTPTTHQTTETTPKAPTLPTVTTPEAPTPTTAPTQGTDANLTAFQLEAARREVEAKAEEIRFLRGLVEQRDRDAAELRAALREALKAMPKQLTTGEERAPNLHTESAQITTPTLHPPTHSNGPEIGPQKQKGAALIKEPRPLWKVILGIR
jgi:hypothetical protein